MLHLCQCFWHPAQSIDFGPFNIHFQELDPLVLLNGFEVVQSDRGDGDQFAALCFPPTHDAVLIPAINGQIFDLKCAILSKYGRMNGHRVPSLGILERLVQAKKGKRMRLKTINTPLLPHQPAEQQRILAHSCTHIDNDVIGLGCVMQKPPPTNHVDLVGGIGLPAPDCRQAMHQIHFQRHRHPSVLAHPDRIKKDPNRTLQITGRDYGNQASHHRP